MTIATAEGFKVGEKYKVVNWNRASVFAHNTVLTFSKDDGSTMPWFEDQNGKGGYVALWRLEPFVEISKKDFKLSIEKSGNSTKIVFEGEQSLSEILEIVKKEIK